MSRTFAKIMYWGAFGGSFRFCISRFIKNTIYKLLLHSLHCLHCFHRTETPYTVMSTRAPALLKRYVWRDKWNQMMDCRSAHGAQYFSYIVLTNSRFVETKASPMNGNWHPQNLSSEGVRDQLVFFAAVSECERESRSWPACTLFNFVWWAHRWAQRHKTYSEDHVSCVKVLCSSWLTLMQWM